MLAGLFSKNWDFEGLKKSNTFWLVSPVVETEGVQGAGSCMPSSNLGNALPLFKKWVDSLFTSGLLDSFTQVKIKEVGLT